MTRRWTIAEGDDASRRSQKFGVGSFSSSMSVHSWISSSNRTLSTVTTPQHHPALLHTSALPVLPINIRNNIDNTADRPRTSPVHKMANKLNELFPGEIFFCGGPPISDVDEVLPFHPSLHRLQKKKKKNQKHALHLAENDNLPHEPTATSLIENGVEVDTENSLRPSYNLYRV